MGAPTGFPSGINSPSIGGQPLAGRVWYVGNRSGLPSSNGKDPDHPFSTINAALAKNIASRGDVIRVLPGHVDPLGVADALSALVANVTIEGMGTGNQRGIIRWTAAGSTLLLDQAGTILRNLRLQMAGDPASTTALTVAAPITASAAGCAILDCDWQVGVDADQIVTVALATTAGAKDLRIEDNYIVGDPAAEITAAGTVIRLIGADRCRIRRNVISAALATDTDGLIESLTTASLDLDVSDNYLNSSGAGSTCAVDMGAALACTGRFQRNLMKVVADGTAETVVLTRHANTEFAFLDNFLVNNKSERGLVIGTASA